MERRERRAQVTRIFCECGLLGIDPPALAPLCDAASLEKGE